MSKTIFNFWLDLFLLVVFLVLCLVTAIVQFVFPPGPSAQGWSLWGWDYVAWRDLQFGTVCLFAASVLLHVMMHWTWVCGVITTRIVNTRNRPSDGIRTIWGVATLIVIFNLLAAIIAVAMLTVDPAP